jgi:hypothetical protein
MLVETSGAQSSSTTQMQTLTSLASVRPACTIFGASCLGFHVDDQVRPWKSHVKAQHLLITTMKIQGNPTWRPETQKPSATQVQTQTQTRSAKHLRSIYVYTYISRNTIAFPALCIYTTKEAIELPTAIYAHNHTRPPMHIHI